MAEYEIPNVEEWANLWTTQYPNSGITKENILSAIKNKLNDSSNYRLCTFNVLLNATVEKIESNGRIIVYKIFESNNEQLPSNLIASVNTIKPIFSPLFIDCSDDLCETHVECYDDYDECNDDLCFCDIEEPWDPSA